MSRGGSGRQTPQWDTQGLRLACPGRGNWTRWLQGPAQPLSRAPTCWPAQGTGLAASAVQPGLSDTPASNLPSREAAVTLLTGEPSFRGGRHGPSRHRNPGLSLSSQPPPRPPPPSRASDALSVAQPQANGCPGARGFAEATHPHPGTYMHAHSHAHTHTGTCLPTVHTAQQPLQSMWDPLFLFREESSSPEEQHPGGRGSQGPASAPPTQHRLPPLEQRAEHRRWRSLLAEQGLDSPEGRQRKQEVGLRALGVGEI